MERRLRLVHLLPDLPQAYAGLGLGRKASLWVQAVATMPPGSPRNLVCPPCRPWHFPESPTSAVCAAAEVASGLVPPAALAGSPGYLRSLLYLYLGYLQLACRRLRVRFEG